jgi:hypothetical protein
MALMLATAAGLGAADCDLSAYKPVAGLQAAQAGGVVTLTWRGENGAHLRASFAIEGATPIVKELAVKAAVGAWISLGRNLTPEFDITTGRRRISNQQLDPVRRLGVPVTPDLVEREKWNVFWDAPLNVPGGTTRNLDLPRKPEEIARAKSEFRSSNCVVKTNGSRLELFFDGLTLGSFSGSLQFTAYSGSNLLRQEALAKTDQPSVAYRYGGGLRGFTTSEAKRVVWRDVARAWQKYEFGGAKNDNPVALRARNRLAIVETGGGSLAVFPPPHKFFFAREIELNLGYVWYRNDGGGSFAVGVRQPEKEEAYRPYGYSEELWRKRVGQARGFAEGNFALYNAPPGTMQRMAVYYYLSPAKPEATRQAIAAYTHDDTYPALPGYKVAISHFHTHFHEQLLDAGSFDVQPTWLPVFRALGVNIAMMSDFHGDGHDKDPGPVRFMEQNAYFEGCKRHSDNDFLLMPGEEPDAYFGGHYTMVFPRPVYWSKVRTSGQQFTGQDSKYGRVYHISSEADEFEMLQREGGLVWQAHPRTKGSTLYPDSVKEKEYFKSDRFLGGSYQSLPVDLSEDRICEKRCFGLLDDMNNWGAPKYMFAEGDTYMKYPDDETFPHLIVNYVKLDRVPRFDEDWSPILKSLRAGDFFVSTGEILIPNWSVGGAGANRTVKASVKWTFPLEFVEIVWGDGTTAGRKVVPATDLAPFGSKDFAIPFDAAGKKWVRFAVWDSAGNGAFTQPVHLK